MADIALTLVELGAVVFAAVTLAATDPSALSRLFLAYLAKKLGVEARQIRSVDRATDGDTDAESADGSA